MDDISDDRIRNMQTDLTNMLQLGGDGLANNMIWKSELALLLIEVTRARQKPSHCPSCDGDHL